MGPRSFSRLHTSESDVYTRQILTYKDSPHAERFKVCIKDRHGFVKQSPNLGGRGLINLIFTPRKLFRWETKLNFLSDIISFILLIQLALLSVYVPSNPRNKSN